MTHVGKVVAVGTIELGFDQKRERETSRQPDGQVCVV